jgi:hypothetical protein
MRARAVRPGMVFPMPEGASILGWATISKPARAEGFSPAVAAFVCGVTQSARPKDQRSGGGGAPHRSASDDEHGAGAHDQDSAWCRGGGNYLDAHRIVVGERANVPPIANKGLQESECRSKDHGPLAPPTEPPVAAKHAHLYVVGERGARDRRAVATVRHRSGYGEPRQRPWSSRGGGEGSWMEGARRR